MRYTSLVAALLLFLCACSGNNAANDSAGAQSSPTTSNAADDSASAQNAGTTAGDPVASPSPSPVPTPRTTGTFTGKIASLPEPAQTLLNFEPVDNDEQTQSETIAARIEEGCGDATADYLGADDFPGSITIENDTHGAWRISWTTKCGGVLGAVAGAHPTFAFRLTHDDSHIIPLNNAADFAVH